MELVEIVEGVEAIEGLPAVKVEGYVVIADLHLGYEEAMAREGVFLPRVQLRNALVVLRRLSRVKARRLIVAGDIKHAFDKLLKSERAETRRFLEEALTVFSEVLVLRGNHDNYISGVVKETGADFIEEPYIKIGDIHVTHGHKDPGEYGRVIILGHEHPAIQVRVAGSRVKFPVFLKVPLEGGSTAIVLPATGTYQTGNIVGAQRSLYLSPIIKHRGLVEEALPYIMDESGKLIKLVPLSLLEEILD